MVMNYVPDNLNRIIRNHVKNKEEFPIFLVKLYSFQMIRAIAYIHSLDILNRDVKPQNVLIDVSTNRVYICDFGSAKRIRKGITLFIKKIMLRIFARGTTERLN